MGIRTLLLTFAFAMMASSNAPGQRVETGFLDRVVNVDGHDYRYQVYVPSNYTTAQRWPVIVFLHGGGERGSDGLFQTAVGLAPAIRRNPARYPALVVFPQTPSDSAWVGRPAQAAMAALEQTEREFQTDPDRVYLTGLSLGGNGTWYLAYRHPDRFAAVVPICGWVSSLSERMQLDPVVPSADGAPFETLARKLARVPIWIFHGEVDDVIPAEQSRQAAAALKAIGSNARYTELLGVNHNSWDAAYGSTEFSNWLFAQRRGS